MLTAQVARLLAALGKKVVVAAFDFDAPGVLGAFDRNIVDVECAVDPMNREGATKDIGLFELFNKFKNFNRPSKNVEVFLNDCMISVDELKFKGTNSKNNGKIKILKSGHVNKNYWNNISGIEWLESLSRPMKEITSASSFLRFTLRVLKPALESMGIDYLLIDTRAGVTYYGSIGRYVADRQVMIFCPNKETESAIPFLVPSLEESIRERLNVYKETKKKKHQYVLPLEKVVFVVSRIPPEFAALRNKVFDKMKGFIESKILNIRSSLGETNVNILKLHSDLETHLNPTCRNFDERYLNRESKKDHVVQIHEDILMILAALCPPEECDCASIEKEGNELLKEQAKNLWKKIYNYDFRITYENRLFGLLSGSEIQNPDDETRNVAFKVETFLNFLNTFYKTLEGSTGLGARVDDVMNQALHGAGHQCGEAFGKALATQWSSGTNEEKSYSPKQKIEQWCEFDTRAGFGLMSYNEAEKTLKIEKPFIMDTNIHVEKRDYTAFLYGYVKGVLTELLNTIAVSVLEQKKENNVIKYTIEKGICNESESR